ncbi:DUF3644 domain-containing protein [Litoribacter populi]|uniref:DUF3644 domain-containing protein n=1 Tax=Litoribacter populi TaxID=2598460 RepID=UPI00117CC339|nr:DUF3644 domain-containing protein [Litoribacter populi]
MSLRRGKSKLLIESAIDCSLLAVEVYNKPRAPFRVETFITHMIMAWTRAFHAYYHQSIGEKYFYKDKGGRYYIRIDGEKKAWELKTCIDKNKDLDESVKANLTFFIKLRNKIEHHYINKEDIGVIIFGECQSLLNNFEAFVIDNFGEEYALNESLAFALQFSKIRTDLQRQASKNLLSKEVKELKDFIEKYRSSIDDNTFNSQEYSVKLIAIPKISNTNRSDLAVEFVNWNQLSDEEKENYKKIVTIIKEKTLVKEVINTGKLKAAKVVEKVNKKIKGEINQYDHTCLYYIFSIRPTKPSKDPFDTNTKYCHYDEPNNNYLYQKDWVHFIADLINLNVLEKEVWKNLYYSKNTIPIKEYQDKIKKAKQEPVAI